MKATSIKIMELYTILISVMLIASAFSNPLARADEEAEAKVEIPATTEAIWQSIDKETEELAAVIQAGKLDEVHHHAFAIRDLTTALPERSSALPADKLANVKTYSQFVATLAERLDASGDAKDKAETESNFQKLQGVLDTMRKNYAGSAQM